MAARRTGQSCELSLRPFTPPKDRFTVPKATHVRFVSRQLALRTHLSVTINPADEVVVGIVDLGVDRTFYVLRKLEGVVTMSGRTEITTTGAIMRR